MAIMRSRQWLSAVALVAIALAVVLSRWAGLAGWPQPHPISAAATAGVGVESDPRASAAALPRVNLGALAGANRAAVPAQRSPRPPVDDAVTDHAWAAAVPQPAAPIASAERSSAPSPSTSEPSRVSELMVCHLDTRGAYGTADALQECINRAPAYSSLEIPPGTYVLHRQVVVSTPLTIRTAGSAGTPLSCAANSTSCAVLAAAPDLLAMWGPLVVWSTNNVSLEHLVIDGNRSARVTSTAAGFCLTRSNTFGFNALFIN